MLRTLTLATVLAACSTPTLDTLPSPETCRWVYDVGQVNDVTLAMDIGSAGGSAFVPVAGDVELSTTSDGRWGFAIDLRITTTDPITFPETVCSEVNGTLAALGDVDKRGLLFRRQTDGSMLARNVTMDPNVMPSPNVPFRGVVRENYPLGPSTRFGFATYSSAVTATATVNLVNNVGFLSGNSDGPRPDAPVRPDASSVMPWACIGLLADGTTPYCTQFNELPTSGTTPPANALQSYEPTYCPGGNFATPGTCTEPINSQNQTAVCTVLTTEAWGMLAILAYSYGPIADPTGDRATCESRGGTYSSL